MQFSFLVGPSLVMWYDVVDVEHYVEHWRTLEIRELWSEMSTCILCNKHRKHLWMCCPIFFPLSFIPFESCLQQSLIFWETSGICFDDLGSCKTTLPEHRNSNQWLEYDCFLLGWLIFRGIVLGDVITAWVVVCPPSNLVRIVEGKSYHKNKTFKGWLCRGSFSWSCEQRKTNHPTFHEILVGY